MMDAKGQEERRDPLKLPLQPVVNDGGHLVVVLLDVLQVQGRGIVTKPHHYIMACCVCVQVSYRLARQMG